MSWALQEALRRAIPPRETPTDWVYSLAGMRVPQRPWQLQDLLREHGVPPTGVVHLGAHYGQELETYLACGFRHILYAEANPYVYARLMERVSFWGDWLDTLREAYNLEPPWLRAVHRAVGSQDGPVVLHRNEYDMQGSLLASADASIREVEQLEVPGARLDSLLAQEGVQASDFSLLHMDIQGAEILAMESGPELLSEIRMVLTEVNYQPRYQGCPSPEDLDAFLEARGFRRVLRTGPFPDYPVGDALYVKSA